MRPGTCFLSRLRCSVLVLQCCAVCCSVLQRVAVCCNVLQCGAVCFRVGSILVCCSVLQCVAGCCRISPGTCFRLRGCCSVLVLQCVAVCCSVLQCVAMCCNAFQSRVVESVRASEWVCCSVLRCVAVNCSVLQCVAVCCNAVYSRVVKNVRASEWVCFQRLLSWIYRSVWRCCTRNFAKMRGCEQVNGRVVDLFSWM